MSADTSADASADVPARIIFRYSRKLKFGMKDNEKLKYCTQLQTKINHRRKGERVPNNKCQTNHKPQILGNF